jgi:oligoribonuclease (3'-5' exoribonuclease)
MQAAKYICFDTESSGLDSTINNLLTVCFIVLDKNLNELDRLNLSIKHESYNIVIKALEINKINLIKHHNSSVDILTAKNILINFLNKYKPKYSFIPICHNCNHDISFIQNSGLLPKELYKNYFSYNVIDTIILAQFLKLSNKLPEYQSISLSSLINYFALNNNNVNVNFHTAEYDTEMTVKLLQKFRELNTTNDVVVVKKKKNEETEDDNNETVNKKQKLSTFN